MSRTILILDGDPCLVRDFRIRAEEGGYAVMVCPTLDSTAREALDSGRVDLVLASPDRQEVTAAELCRHVRSYGDVPLAVVSEDGRESTVIACFEEGADDYIRKPFRIAELDVRTKALLRRSPASREARGPLHRVVVGGLEVDLDARRVYKGGSEVSLSPTEFKVLAALAEAQGKVLSPRAIISRVWGSSFMEQSHYLRLYVRYLRQKIEDDPKRPRYIINRWGSGYALGDGR